ncbi:unnamed protein product, partial [Prorocentrum cordatum]
ISSGCRSCWRLRQRRKVAWSQTTSMSSGSRSATRSPCQQRGRRCRDGTA